MWDLFAATALGACRARVLFTIYVIRVRSRESRALSERMRVIIGPVRNNRFVCYNQCITLWNR